MGDISKHVNPPTIVEPDSTIVVLESVNPINDFDNVMDYIDYLSKSARPDKTDKRFIRNEKK